MFYERYRPLYRCLGIYEAYLGIKARTYDICAPVLYRQVVILIFTDHAQLFHDLTMLYILKTLIICPLIHSLCPSLSGRAMLTKAVSGLNNWYPPIALA